MRILLVDRNLFWTVRFSKALQSLGHEAISTSGPPWPNQRFDAAILNLGTAGLSVEWVRSLQEQGAYVIGHAGHKEAEKLDLGNAMGCDYVATNSEITHKLADLLTKVG